jgi:hypothetical protein
MKEQEIPEYHTNELDDVPQEVMCWAVLQQKWSSEFMKDDGGLAGKMKTLF